MRRPSSLALVALLLLAPTGGATFLLDPLFLEDWESGSNGWSMGGSGSVRCGDAAHGCYLRVTPPCCYADVHRVAFSTTLTSTVSVLFSFRSYAVSGNADTLLRVELGEDNDPDNDIDVSFTGPGAHDNDGIYLASRFVDASPSTFASVPVPGRWYTISVDFVPATGLVTASLYEDRPFATEDSIATSQPRIYDATALRISGLSIRSALWSGTTGSFDYDEISVHRA